MWQLQSFPAKSKDSDQSISDEDEEQDSPWPEKFVSLGGSFDRKKESVGLASQFELLKGVRQWKNAGFSSEDEVEAPEFCNQSNVNRQCIAEGDSISLKRDDSTFEPDEQLSNVQKGAIQDNVSGTLNMYTDGKQKQNENFTQTDFYREKRRLDSSTETTKWPSHQSFYLKERNPAKGGRRKGVAGPSSHGKPYKKGLLWSLGQTDKDPNLTSSDELLDEPEAIDSCPKETTSQLEQEHPHDEILKSRLASPVGTVIQHDDCRRSMAELLDHLQGENNKPYRNCKTAVRRKERSKRHGVIQNLPLSRNNLRSDEDTGESMDSGSSTDNEQIAQDTKSGAVGSGRKTMADKFQDAFGSAPVLDTRPSFMAPKLSSSGLFGRLQQVMQWQKDQDTEFLKKQQTEVWPKDEARCLDVKILSRSFDAKLTVSHCSSLENEESSLQNPQQESFQKTWTVIFNPRVCGDVDLEVGNLIRICPPWKEAQVLRCGEIIILATYFSQM